MATQDSGHYNAAIRASGIRLNANEPFIALGTVTLPAGTTINGSTVAGVGNVTGSATTGATFSVTNSGIYTGVGADQVIANALTIGVASMISATNLTTGTIQQLKATAATMTTGRYISAYDGTAEVFGIGTNGHIISVGTAAAATAAITTAQGITAATVTAGATDTCGIITTTGTQNNTADSTLTVTFGKTYTTAPKTITLTPANAAAALAGAGLAYISSVSATAFVVGIAKSGTTAATPSWMYQVIA